MRCLFRLAALTATVLAAAPTSPLVRAHATTFAAARCAQRIRASGTLTVSDAQAGSIGPALYGGLEAMGLDQLFRYDNRGHLFPMMATAVPSLKNGGLQAGGKTIIVHLKHGLRWSDGSEITSADINFGWHVDSDDTLGDPCAGACDVIKSIVTPDRYTAVFHLSRVDPTFVSPDVDSGGSMPRVWAKNSPAWRGNPRQAAIALSPDSVGLNRKILTDGPFQQVSLRNNRLTLRPMRYYDDMTCGASIAKIVYTSYNTGGADSSAGQTQAAVLGKIGVGLNYFSADAPNLTRQAKTYRVHVQPTFTFEHLALNLDPSYQGKPNPLAGLKVRLALALALNKSALIRSTLTLNANQARDVEAWSPWVHTPHLLQPYSDPKVTGQWDPLARGGKGAYLSSTGTGQALSDARKLLASTRWRNGFSLDMYTIAKPERLVSMPVVAAQWKKIGVHVVPHVVSVPDLYGTWEDGGILSHGAFQVALFGEAGGPNPDSMHTFMESRYVDRDRSQHSRGNENYAGIRDGIIDRSWEQAIGTLDQRIRKRDFFAVQERMNQRSYWIPLYYIPDISSSSRTLVNFRPNPIYYGETWNIYDWRVKS